MSGALLRQFSIAVWDFAWSPLAACVQTICGSPALMPKPARNPSCRSWLTVVPGVPSIIAIFAGLPAITALAYWPINWPAVMLLVANRASLAFCGFSGVSSAMTSTPAARAFWMVGTMALLSLGVMRMPLTPALTIFSIAVTWPALSPSYAPAAVSRLTSLVAASFAAPSFILTKKGLVSVLVINPTLIWPAVPPEVAAWVAVMTAVAVMAW